MTNPTQASQQVPSELPTPEIMGSLLDLPEHVQRVIKAYGDARERVALHNERAVLAAAMPGQVEAWQPIETAPMGEVILLYFPRYERPNSVLTEMFKVERWPSHTPRKATLWKRIDPPKSASVSEQKGDV